jgi:diguanylate cyclase (GGDEF)-like protein/PAS domain S-box-containing protein
MRASELGDAPPSGPAADHRLEIIAAQVHLLFRQTSNAFFATLCNAALLAVIVSEHVPHAQLVTWLAAVGLLTFTRHMLVRTYRRANPPAADSDRWGRRFVVGAFLSGLTWGVAGGLFFVEESVLHQLFLAFVLGGMAAGGMSTLSSYRGAYLAFLGPTVIPYSLRTMAYGGDVHVAMGMMFLLFVLMMWMISRRLHRMLTESLMLRFDNLDLLNEVVLAQDRQNAINRVLENQIIQKRRAERALQNANEQLEQRVRERTEELALSNNALQQEKELFRVTLESIGDAVITTDFLGNVSYLNPIAERFTGWSDREAVATPLGQVFYTVDAITKRPLGDPLPGFWSEGNGSSGERILIRRDDRQFAIDYSMAPIRDRDGGIIGAVLTFRDVTERLRLAQRLAHLAAHDPLTGLLNRHEFERRLKNVLASAREDDPHALLYLDLDQFKVVNDTCGHAAGDELLRQVTTLLQSKIRSRDTLARLGGDEFGILLEHCPHSEALRIAHSLRELIQGFRFGWQEKSFTIGVSIGLFPITQSGETLATALSAADSACYAAKDGGRNRVHVYRPDDSVLLRRSGEMQWLPRIQQAMRDDRFCLFLQPIVPVSPNRQIGEYGEILLRLKDEQGRLIAPGAFLPSAERYAQMIAIDRWVVCQCLKLLKAHAPADEQMTYAINLSAQALGDENFLDFVICQIQETKVAPSRICFEISENAALADLRHVVRLMSTLKDLGCRFSLDDFGSGLSSFGYLKDVPLDYLKIDGRLVKNMARDPVDRAMVEAIHRIAQVMGLETVAEWVENTETLSLLENMGVEYVQGYWLAEPRLIGGSEGGESGGSPANKPG